jgi:hypothetical protein
LPAEASGFSAAIAEKSRVSWLSEIETEADEPVLLLAEVVEVLVVLLLLLLLQAAAARTKASGATTAAPFLASWIMKYHLVVKETATSRHAGQLPARRCAALGLSSRH